LLKLCTSATKTTAAERAANTRESREWLRGYVVLERRNRVDRTHRRLPTLYTPLSLCDQWHNWHILSLVLPFPHCRIRLRLYPATLPSAWWPRMRRDLCCICYQYCTALYCITLSCYCGSWLGSWPSYGCFEGAVGVSTIKQLVSNTDDSLTQLGWKEEAC
jgi:hypothetical protein